MTTIQKLKEVIQSLDDDPDIEGLVDDSVKITWFVKMGSAYMGVIKNESEYFGFISIPMHDCFVHDRYAYYYEGSLEHVLDKMKKTQSDQAEKWRQYDSSGAYFKDYLNFHNTSSQDWISCEEIGFIQIPSAEQIRIINFE